MKKQTVPVSTRLSDFMRISCVTVLLFTLSACGSNGGGDSVSSGVGGTAGESESSNAPTIKILAANDGVNGTELWKTDGTTAGTVLVKDINTMPGEGSRPHSFTEFNGAFYFHANDGTDNHELWKTDGTDAGTVLVKEINAEGSSNPYGITVFNGALYFSADDGMNGTELWETDGTTAGTVMVKDINPTSDSNSPPYGFIEFNGALYFSADDGVNGYEPWKTHGTADGTVLVKDIKTPATAGPIPYKGSIPTGFTVFKGALYFSADDGVYGAGSELWKTDGTATGTVMVADINTQAGSGSNPYSFTEFNGDLYFQADSGTNNAELWKSDGTAAGTVLVKDINTTPGGAGSFPTLGSLNYGDFIVFNGGLYFRADDGVNGTELWKTDGTNAGTVMVKDINITGAQAGSGPYRFTVFNGALYFSADDGVNGYEPWKTDGTAAGTALVKDINTTSDSFPYSFFILNSALYFYANVSAGDLGLWTTDGTDAGTVLVKDFYP